MSWRIPHVEDLPVNIPVYSPTFVQPFYHHEHVHLHWCVSFLFLDRINIFHIV